MLFVKSRHSEDIRLEVATDDLKISQLAHSIIPEMYSSCVWNGAKISTKLKKNIYIFLGNMLRE
jgi:hypothetical protein